MTICASLLCIYRIIVSPDPNVTVATVGVVKSDELYLYMYNYTTLTNDYYNVKIGMYNVMSS